MLQVQARRALLKQLSWGRRRQKKELSTKMALVYSRRHRRMTNQMSQVKRPKKVLMRKGLRSCNKTLCALFRKKQQYPKHGFCLTVNPLLMCSQTQVCCQTSMMWKRVLYCTVMLVMQLSRRKGTSRDTALCGSTLTASWTFCPWAMYKRSTRWCMIVL